jgi:hypothetical protein
MVVRMYVRMKRFCYKMVCRTMFVNKVKQATLPPFPPEMAEASHIPSDKKPDPFNNR